MKKPFYALLIGWQFEDKVLPLGIPKISFGLAVYTALISQRIIGSKLGMEPMFDVPTGMMKLIPTKDKIGTEIKSAIGTFPSLSVTPDCISHDLVCTFPGMKADGQHMSFWIPPIGHFDADFGSCCLNHDIDWWCSTTLTSVLWANNVVAACCLGQLMNAAYKACKDKLSCGGLSRLFCDLAVAACDVAVSIVIVALDLLPVILAGVLAFGLDLATVWVAYFKNHKQYFDFDRQHQDSCLCGGNKPTIQCPGAGKYGPCIDICKLANKAGSEQCYKCGWRCEYDSSGKSSKVFDSGTDYGTNPNGWACCPDTTYDCTASNEGPPCPTCAECAWGCDCDKQTHTWIPGYDMWLKDTNQVVDKSSGIRCCDGSNPYNPPPLRQWLDCQANDGVYPC